MSIIMDTDTCYTFETEHDFAENFGLTESIGYVPMKFNGKQYIFKVKITKSTIKHNCSYRATEEDIDDNRYLSFSILYNEKKYTSINLKTVMQKAYKDWKRPVFYNVEDIEKELKIDNYYYTPDFYSCFMPDGFLPTEILFSTVDKALGKFEEEIPKYFIYSQFKRNVEKALVNI